MTPSDSPREQHDDVALVAELIAQHIEIDGDVIEIDEDKWALHGRIAYDGEVIAATFITEHDARAALSRLDEIERDEV